jgi:hypothetical protein
MEQPLLGGLLDQCVGQPFGRGFRGKTAKLHQFMCIPSMAELPFLT